MQGLKHFLVFLIAIALAAAVVFFTLENRTPVHLLFFSWKTPDLPIALFVISAFVLGLIIGPLLSWWPHQRVRMLYNKQVKQLRACEKKIQSLQKAKVTVIEETPALPSASVVEVAKAS